MKEKIVDSVTAGERPEDCEDDEQADKIRETKSKLKEIK